jgi:hypothetical protein
MPAENASYFTYELLHNSDVTLTHYPDKVSAIWVFDREKRQARPTPKSTSTEAYLTFMSDKKLMPVIFRVVPKRSRSADRKTLSPLERAIGRERLRQARNASNIAHGSAVIALGVSILGLYWGLTGKVPEGALTTTGGTTASALCCRLAKDANDRLDHLLEE